MIESLGIIYIGFVVIIWILIAFYIFKVVALKKPQVDMWRETMWNPFNLILMGSKLTAEGLRARKKLFILVATFALITILPLLIRNLIIYLNP